MEDTEPFPEEDGPVSPTGYAEPIGKRLECHLALGLDKEFIGCAAQSR